MRELVVRLQGARARGSTFAKSKDALEKAARGYKEINLRALSSLKCFVLRKLE